MKHEGTVATTVFIQHAITRIDFSCNVVHNRRLSEAPSSKSCLYVQRSVYTSYRIYASLDTAPKRFIYDHGRANRSEKKEMRQILVPEYHDHTRTSRNNPAPIVCYLDRWFTSTTLEIKKTTQPLKTTFSNLCYGPDIYDRDFSDCKRTLLSDDKSVLPAPKFSENTFDFLLLLWQLIPRCCPLLFLARLATHRTESISRGFVQLT